MTNRREFLQTGLSVSALPLTNGLLSPEAAGRDAGNTIAVHKAVFDDRYAESRAFAETIGGFGVPRYALKNGDITDLWYGELDRLWRDQPVAIAGLTQFGPMFALERLARERGMHIVLRAEHQARTDGTIAHVMTGPAETVALAEQLRLEVADWPILMVALMTHCRGNGSNPVEHTMVMPGARPVLKKAPASASTPESVIHYYTPQAIQEGHEVPWDGPLFSWVIAPTERT